jgi:hypothetical protein
MTYIEQMDNSRLKLSTDFLNGLSGLSLCINLIRLIRYNNPLTALKELVKNWHVSENSLL